MLRFLAFFLMLICIAPVASAHPETPTQTTYLGNEGIMVSDGHTTILFDPLYPNGFGTYQMVPEAMRQDLMAGAAPYDNVDAIFISHMHPDHFSVDEVITYLQVHPQVRLFAPAQAVDWMREETDDDAIFDRVTPVGLERLDAPLSFQEGGLTIDVVRIPHAGWPGRAEVSNLVWRVTLSDGITVMHLGDADPRDEHYAPHADHWMATRTDNAYPPYWFFSMGDGPQILSTRLNTLKSTGIHVPIELPAELFVTGADFFHTPGETRLIQKVGDE
jgi:L-ascorbate metabolism protein UlaG (beta-lactamase superfamily)